MTQLEISNDISLWSLLDAFGGKHCCKYLTKELKLLNNQTEESFYCLLSEGEVNTV